MLKTPGPWCAVMLSFLPFSAAADIAAIHADQLPKDAHVISALKDAAELEPYSAYFVQPWKFPVARDEVAQRLKADMQGLDAAVRAHPENAELLLLTSLVARYAYNVDVEGSHEIAMQSFAAAAKLGPGDFRPGWFQATLKCQTNESRQGAVEFLAIEDSHQSEQLPAAFWDDYIECATITNMPGHVLRAADTLEKMHAPNSPRRTVIVQTARNRFVLFDPKKKYDDREVWEGANTGDETVFTSTVCGVRLRVPVGWSVDRMGFSNGSCVADFLTQFYPGTVHQRRPSVMLMVQQPKDGEDLEQYSMRFRHRGTFTPFEPVRCPAEKCIALKAVQPGMYGEDGDGHGRVVFFERDQPAYPDLALEAPTSLPTTSGNETQTFRPGKIQGRIPGRLYYLVLLDAAASIEEPAMKDYDLFLRSLTVE